MNCAKRFVGVAACMCMGLITFSAPASIIQTDNLSTASQEAFAPSGTSLIEATAPSLQSISATESLLGAPGGTSPLNDGGTSGYAYFEGDYSVTVVLDTSVNLLGYNITSVATIAGWTDNRFEQTYDVSYTTVDNPTPMALASVSYLTSPVGANHSTKVVLTDTSGLLATGVKSITFDMQVPVTVGTIWRELEVEGFAIVPEPSSMSLAMLCMTMLLKRRRV